jgi:ubiquinone/menaquinone biosynthesis C-methylase UbiE
LVKIALRWSRTVVDVSQFTVVDQVYDPAAMIEMLDRLNRFLRAPKDALLDRLVLQGARVALDVGCGTGGDVVEMGSRCRRGVRRSAWTSARR